MFLMINLWDEESDTRFIKIIYLAKKGKKGKNGIVIIHGPPKQRTLLWKHAIILNGNEFFWACFRHLGELPALQAAYQRHVVCADACWHRVFASSSPKRVFLRWKVYRVHQKFELSFSKTVYQYDTLPLRIVQFEVLTEWGFHWVN